ncbi:hypothetical protein [Pseudohaliea sp.]|uniref:hypothetical protein n=1 Tax=Pseudohaliea sp. TaxID=2740289 RepID=UPI0032ED743B
MRYWSLLALLALVSAVQAAQESADATAAAVPEDGRQAVAMPPLQRALLREEMIQHTATVQQLVDLLGKGELARAAEVAERDLGLSSMGKHAAATRGMGPGRFFPQPMRSVGIGMHEAASRFAEVAREDDGEAALKALSPVLGACVSCHSAYRLE